VCNYAYKSFADAGIYFNPDEHVLTRQKSWPDNARSCSFGIDVGARRPSSAGTAATTMSLPWFGLPPSRGSAVLTPLAISRFRVRGRAGPHQRSEAKPPSFC
jgi:hypothetical protein